jgi:hypothetical protein
LAKASGYLLTEISGEDQQAGQYRVKDYWVWHRDFELFRTRRQAEFARFEQWLYSERLIEKEQFLGAYYEKFDKGDETDLMLS